MLKNNSAQGQLHLALFVVRVELMDKRLASDRAA